jgi:hypothetical protein
MTESRLPPVVRQINPALLTALLSRHQINASLKKSIVNAVKNYNKAINDAAKVYEKACNKAADKLDHEFETL